MSEFFKAELKDKFLEYAHGRDDYFEVQLLYDEFLRPNYSLQYVEKLLREIIDHDHNLLDIMSGNGVKIFMLSSTAYTEEFLEEGGFKDLYIEEEERWDIFLEQLSNTRRLSSEEKADLGRTEKAIYKRKRLVLFSLIGAVACSFLFTVYSLLKPLFLKTDVSRIVEIEKKLKTMEHQNKGLRQELDSVLQLYEKKIPQ